MLARAATAMAAALLSTCAQGNPLMRQSVRKICPDGVALFAAATSVPSLYKEVGLLSAKEPMREAPQQRQEAAELGANGIILTSGTKVNPANMIGPAIGNMFVREGKMVAIYIPADTARVESACRPTPAGQPSSTTTAPVPVIGAPIASASTHSRSRGDRTPERVPVTTREPERMRPFDLSGRETDAAESLKVIPQPDTSSVFARNADVRAALANLKRLNLATGAEEVRAGLVRVHISGMKPRAQLEYHMSLLHGAYQAALPYRQAAIIELWSNGAKFGEYTSDGLFLGSGQEAR